MKLFFALLGLLLSIVSYGQDARTSDRYIKSSTRQYAKYIEGIDINQLDANPMSYYNYYFNYLFANYPQRHSSGVQDQLEQTIAALKEISPNSFEFYYLTFHFTQDYTYLIKAYDTAPEEVAIWDELLGYYELTNNTTKARAIAKKIAISSKYSEDTYRYQRNVLASCHEGGVIFTQGELDTYPLLVLLYTENQPHNLQVIGINLLKNTSYRSRVLAKAGIPAPSSYTQISTLLNNVHATNHPIYLSLMTKKSQLLSLQSKLYLSGLLFQYSSQPLQNIQWCHTLFNEKLDMNYLFNKNYRTMETRLMNKNYLPLLQTLRTHDPRLTKEMIEKIDHYKNALE